MKTTFFIAGIFFLASCTSSKSNNVAVAEEQAVKNSVPKGIPVCLQKMISHFQSEEKQNPPRQIYSYLYKGATVYYVTPPCCDFFSDLYDSSCVLIGHPDGGFTGKGDGKMSDFRDVRTNEKLVWRDDRK